MDEGPLKGAPCNTPLGIDAHQVATAIRIRIEFGKRKNRGTNAGVHVQLVKSIPGAEKSSDAPQKSLEFRHPEIERSVFRQKEVNAVGVIKESAEQTVYKVGHDPR